MTNRWMPVSGYWLSKVNGQVLVLKQGGLWVKDVSDDEVMLRPIATANDYDEGVCIIRALRGIVTHGKEGD